MDPDPLAAAETITCRITAPGGVPLRLNDRDHSIRQLTVEIGERFRVFRWAMEQV